MGLLVGTMSPASAAKRKPPTITGASAAGRLVNQGAVFPFEVSVKNSSKKRSRPLTLLFVLSDTSDFEDGVVLGSGVVPALGRKAGGVLPFSVTIPPTQEDDDYRLLICIPKGARTPTCPKSVTVDVEEVVVSSGGTPLVSAVPSSTNTRLPSSILFGQFASWKLTLPVDASGGTGTPREVRQTELKTFRDPRWFNVNDAGTGVIFRAPADGATTDNTDYSRSELREMTDSTSSQSNKSWSPASGTHSMAIDQAITHLPGTETPNVVVGQIHDGDDDVLQVRLEGSRLFVTITGRPDITLTGNYVLGTRFIVAISVSGGGYINVWYGPNAQSLAWKGPNVLPSGAGSSWYFKAGCYTQSNEDGAYSEVVVYGLSVAHS